MQKSEKLSVRNSEVKIQSTIEKSCGDESTIPGENDSSQGTLLTREIAHGSKRKRMFASLVQESMDGLPTDDSSNMAGEPAEPGSPVVQDDAHESSDNEALMMERRQ